MAKKQTEQVVEQAAPDNQLPTQFVIDAPAREVVEQLNLRVPSEFTAAKQAAIACFHALNDPGGNNPTSLTIDLDNGITVAVKQTAYVHGES